LKSGVSLNAVLLSVVMVNVVMLSEALPSVVIPNVVLPSVVAPVGKRGSGRSSSDLELETLAHLGGPWTRLKSGKVAMGPVAPNALPRLVSRLAYK